MQMHIDSRLDSLPRSVDVVVVGAGIVGLAAAFFLAKEGLGVAILEKRRRPADLTSARSGEGVRAQWETPDAIALMLRSIELYQRFAELTGREENTAELSRCGYLYAATSARGAIGLADRVARQRANGLSDVSYLTGAEARRRFTTLSETTRGVAFRAGDGTVVVDRIVAGYLAATPARLLTQTLAHGVCVRGGAVEGVETDRGKIATRTCVIAAGPYASALLEPFDGAPPISLVRGQIACFGAEGVPADHPATVDVDNGTFWRPDSTGLRITAPARDAETVATPIDDPRPDVDYPARALAGARRLCPFIAGVAKTAVARAVHCGLYAVTPDGLPAIGPLRTVDGLFVNVGFGGLGVMASIAAGERLAAVISGAGAHDPMSAFAPERFHDGRLLSAEPMTVNHLSGGSAHAPPPASEIEERTG